MAPVRRALDQIIRRLTAVGKQNLHCAAGIIFRLAAPRARAVKKNRDRRACRILILREHLHQRIARGLGMTRRTRRQLRPVVQQAVTVNKDSHQRHARIVAVRGQRENVISKCRETSNNQHPTPNMESDERRFCH